MACEIQRPESPHVSTHRKQRTGEQVINVVVRYHCRARLESHTVHLSLERRSGGEWVTVLDHTVPKPTGAIVKAKITYQGCRPGWWRARAQAHTVFRGQDYESPVRWSPKKKIKRKDCR